MRIRIRCERSSVIFDVATDFHARLTTTPERLRFDKLNCALRAARWKLYRYLPATVDSLQVYNGYRCAAHVCAARIALSVIYLRNATYRAPHYICLCLNAVTIVATDKLRCEETASGSRSSQRIVRVPAQRVWEGKKDSLAKSFLSLRHRVKLACRLLSLILVSPVPSPSSFSANEGW